MDRAKSYYQNLLTKNDVFFSKEFENGVFCNFELAIIEKDSSDFSLYFIKDDLGRNLKVDIDDPSSKIISINPYKVEEKIQDVSQNKKISFEFFNKKYLGKIGLKLLSKLNNKIVLQNDEDTHLFSLKSELDSTRFLSNLQKKLLDEQKFDVIIVMDCSKEQKKYLYNILETKGFDKSVLYRRYTTFPK
jgi:hypothetical protein